MGAGDRDPTPAGDSRASSGEGPSAAGGDATPAGTGKGNRRLSPAAEAAIARYRRLMGNVSEADADDDSPDGGRSDLDRHLAERPPHWAPPRGQAPQRRRPRRREDS